MKRSTRSILPGGALAAAAIALCLGGGPHAGGPSHALLSPLEGEPSFGSSFGEFRSGHLHAGVDLRTAGRTGLPVRAAAAGEAYRIKREWRGYGLALYVRHPAGFITVYAHLDRLEGENLDLRRRYLELLRASSSRYPGDLYLDPPVPVRRGETIALSGETGAGLPHLHFEVRRGEDVSVDPVLEGLPWHDTQAPAIDKVILLAAAGSSFEGGARTVEVPVSKDGKVAPVVVRGPFLARAECHDPTPSGKAGVPTIELRVDGVMAYRVDIRTLPFSLYRRVGELFDVGRSRLAPARYVYHLYRRAGNILEGSSGDGLIDPPAGEHTLTVLARDRAGHEARVDVPVVVSHARLQIVKAAVDALDGIVAAEGVLEGAAAEGASYRFEAETSRDEGKEWSPLPLSVLWRRRERGADGAPERVSMRSQAGLERSGRTALRLRARRGLETTPWVLILARHDSGGGWRLLPEPGGADRPDDGGPASWEARVEVTSLAVEFLVDARRLLPCPPEAALELAGQPVRRADLIHRGGTLYGGSTPLPGSGGRGWVSFSCAGAAGAARVAFDLNLAVPGRDTEASSGSLQVLVPGSAVLEPTPITIGPGNLPEDPSVPRRSPVYVLGPADASLAGEARLVFKTSDLSSGSRLRTGVYSYDMEAGAWLFAGAQRAGDRISAGVRRFGAYALREDESPPRITATTPARGAAVRAQRPLIVQARVLEKGEGLGPDGVLFLLDGRPVESEFDPDRGLARGVQIPSLQAGPHRLQVRATDLAGNASQTLTVDFSAR